MQDLHFDYAIRSIITNWRLTNKKALLTQDLHSNYALQIHYYPNKNALLTQDLHSYYALPMQYIQVKAAN